MANREPYPSAPDQMCFVCERPFGLAEPPAETRAHGDICIQICRQCVLDPPGGRPTPLDRLPPEIRRPLLLHLRSRALVEQSRGISVTTAQLLDNSAGIRARLKWLKATYSANGTRPDSEPPK